MLPNRDLIFFFFGFYILGSILERVRKVIRKKKYYVWFLKNLMENDTKGIGRKYWRKEKNKQPWIIGVKLVNYFYMLLQTHLIYFNFFY